MKKDKVIQIQKSSEGFFYALTDEGRLFVRDITRGGWIEIDTPLSTNSNTTELISK